jgi:hypothetical protein
MFGMSCGKKITNKFDIGHNLSPSGEEEEENEEEEE